ncbi:hypothetical protein GETHPA_13860 [Geothrix rubra]|uniref:Barstar (barnase inhibitor) domain-containing protein n=1 Tax=Geothrix rubra TaxID=2927977 RepID=A0ABQ5Q5S5_9BACT|nr:barstar family protein [Geothrix rubra]GLH69853.1 hypothetical protein GETHPA_13860 [Geothrix rubra]
MAWAFLASGKGPRFHAWQGSAADLADEVTALAAQGPGRPSLRWLRGGHMRTKAGLLDEWAAAAQFPPYFGGTWDAFRDALAELPEAGAAFFVLEADRLLADAPPQEAATLGAILREVAEELADRPFHVVFQADPARYGTLLEGLRALGLGADEV